MITRVNIPGISLVRGRCVQGSVGHSSFPRRNSGQTESAGELEARVRASCVDEPLLALDSSHDFIAREIGGRSRGGSGASGPPTGERINPVISWQL